jgi:hypothetical protein
MYMGTDGLQCVARLVKRNDPNNAQKWTGMITARLLKSIADDSRAIAKLTWVLVGLALLLFVDIVVRLIH